MARQYGCVAAHIVARLSLRAASSRATLLTATGWVLVCTVVWPTLASITVTSRLAGLRRSNMLPVSIVTLQMALRAICARWPPTGQLKF